MEWTNNLVLEFVHLYEQHPVIWDPENINHKSRKSVADAWSDIRTELSVNFTLEVLKRKKESLMTMYRTLKKKVMDSSRSGIGQEEVYKPAWFAFEPMDRFLKGKINPTIKIEDDSHVYPEDNDEVWELPAKVVETYHYNENQGVDNGNPGIRVYPLTNEVPIKIKRSSTNHIDTGTSKRMKQAADTLQTITEQSPHQQQHPDECELYGQLLATKLRALDKRTRKILTNQIDNLVFEAELRELDRQSPIFHPPHNQTQFSSSSNSL